MKHYLKVTATDLVSRIQLLGTCVVDPDPPGSLPGLDPDPYCILLPITVKPRSGSGTPVRAKKPSDRGGLIAFKTLLQLHG